MSTTPKRLGKYELLERLGRGGVAEVWKALDTQLQRFVAIKLLHPDLRDDPNFVQRFQREAQLIASLHHPNIVQIHDFQIYQPAEEGQEEDAPIAYMVMDYVEGQTLASYIQNTSSKRNFPSPGEIVNIFTSISLAIDYAHKKGMIHRDIKPANILLDQRNTAHNPMGEPILTDFGVAKMLSTTSNTLSGGMLGTPLYLSPEQAKGYAGNERSDLYALGVILYEMVTGTPPFRGDTAMEVVNQHVNATPTAPVLINPATPATLSLVIQRSLAKDPSTRFSSAAALTAAIAEAFQLPIPESLGQPVQSADQTEMQTQLQAPPTPTGAPPVGNIAASMGNTPARSGPPSQPGIAGPISQPGFSGPPSQPGYGGPISQPGISRPISQPGFSGPPSQPGIAGPPSQPGLSTPSQPGFTPIFVHPTPTQLQAAPPPMAAQRLNDILAMLEDTKAQRQTAPPPMAAQPPAPQKQGRALWPYLIVVAAALVVLIGGGIAFYPYLLPVRNTHPAPPNPVVGHAFYISSGQISSNSAQGIADQLQVDLNNIPAPQPGNSYSLWLLGDKVPEPGADLLGGISTRPVKPPLLLTNNLQVNSNGTVDYHYNGDAHHNNLISATSRLLITEGPAGTTASQPPTDRSTWRYYAEIPQEQISGAAPGFSALVHIRHLFYNETNIQALGLPGGLDQWLFKNSEKLVEISTSARDDWQGQGTTPSDIGLMHDLFIRIIDYLDGTVNVNRDVPPGTPVLVAGPDARVALITVDGTYQNAHLDTDPPGYVDHIQLHVGQVAKAPDVTPQMREITARILDSVNNAKTWLTAMRTDDLALIKIMNNPTAMKQPAVGLLLDDMVTQATYAYIGKMNPVTSQVQGGVLQAHYDIQQLAAYTITTNLPQHL
jgi:eukaryotic-like serine/threonine-protein kinase